MKIIITNKIEEKVGEYQKNTGATKVWIAKQLNMSTQNLFSTFKANNPTIETLVKFSLLLHCDITNLFTYKIVESSHIANSCEFTHD